jgi:1,4-dihydroxy-2-naphthoate octaprenyltransferase
MSEIRYLLGPMRIPFVILTPACVFLGFGSAVWTKGGVNLFHLLLVLIGAISAHISVNALNEYADFKSGLDFKTTRTPFSGGSGTLPRRPEKARVALVTSMTAFAITGLIGLYFVYAIGFMLLPLGVLGALVILSYTMWLTRNPLLCLIAPGLGFGPLMVMGTGFVLSGGYSWTAFLSSLVPFFLVSNLLLLNQFPDVEADRRVGRRHVPIVLGKRVSTLIFGVFLLPSYFSIALGVYLKHMPPASLIGLVSIVVAIPTLVGVFRWADDTRKLLPYMGLNVTLVIATPILVGIGLLIG